MNELETESARQLRWLPLTLVEHVVVLLTAIDLDVTAADSTRPSDTACLEVLSAMEQRWGLAKGRPGVLLLPPLQKSESAQLLGKLLGMAGTSLSEGEMVKLVEDIGQSCQSPLYLKLLASHIRDHGLATAGDIPHSIPAVYDSMCASILNDFGQIADVFLTSVFAAPGGLFLSQIR